MIELMLAADSSVFLLSPWKPILFWAAFAGWGWLVGCRLFPDATRLRQGQYGWAWAWILMGFAGLVVMLLGWRFYVSFFAGIIVMLAPILVYWKIRNGLVDDSQKFRLALKRDPASKAKRVAKKAAANAQLQFAGPAGDIPVPAKDDALLGTWLQLEQLLLPALTSGGSRIDLALSSGGLASTCMVHTVRTRQETIPGEDGMRVINLLKEMAGLDQAEMRKRQTARLHLSGEVGRHTMDLTIAGSKQRPLWTSGHRSRRTASHDRRITWPSSKTSGHTQGACARRGTARHCAYWRAAKQRADHKWLCPDKHARCISVHDQNA